MPKKTRRAKAKQRSRSVNAIQGKHTEAVMPTTVKPQLSAKVTPPTQSPISRYQYVIPEVKFIGILAGIIILILIVLSFILG